MTAAGRAAASAGLAEPAGEPTQKVGWKLDPPDLLSDSRHHRGLEAILPGAHLTLREMLPDLSNLIRVELAVEIIVESAKDVFAGQVPVLAHCPP